VIAETLTPAAALDAYRTHRAWHAVQALTHPSRCELEITVADSAAQADPDLIGLVTFAAIAAGMGVRVVHVPDGRRTETLARVACAAHAVGHRTYLTEGPLSSACRFVEVEQ
jgi:hypothetical protein